MNEVIKLIAEDFPTLEIEEVLEVNVSESGESVSGKILTKDQRVYVFILYKDSPRPIIQRFL